MVSSLGVTNVAPAWATAARKLLFTSEGIDAVCRVCSPCVGLDAPARAAKEMGFPNWQSIAVYHVNDGLRFDLDALEPTVLKHLGAVAGDIQRVAVR